MKWSILILTQQSRVEYLQRLCDVLVPQLEGLKHEVELIVRQCDYTLPVGDNRQLLRLAAKGKYSNFLDDDDMVPSNYVETVLPALDTNADFIGHLVKRYDDGQETGVYTHSILHGGSSSPHSTPHINPIKTNIALRVPMSGGYGEDRRWWDAVCLEIENEYFIKEILYSYMYRSNKADGVAF